jgi:Gram-negative bacterial TonB protein C-terminal
MNIKQFMGGCLSLLFALVLHLSVVAQESNSGTVTTVKKYELNEVTKAPVFKGGAKALTAYMEREAKFPAGITREMKPTDIYQIGFTVKADGTIADVYHAGHSERHKQLVQHAIRIISSMPAWTPAQLNGQAVDCHMAIDVDFTRQ